MDLKLNGRVALVTGSTSGIGKAIAALLAAEGARVYVNGRGEESVRRVCEDLSSIGDVRPAAGDVSTADGARQVIAAATAEGAVDILVNNAGVFVPQPFDEVRDDEWERMFRVNVLSGVRLSRELTPAMRERGWGRVVFISSESALNIPTEMVHYGMTKTAQLAVARGLAKTLAGSGVTVNSVLPGPTWTDGVAELVATMAKEQGTTVEDMKERFVRDVRPSSLIQRFVQPEEVASLVAFLCSDLASAITGAAQRVEGGIVDTIA